MKLVDMVLSIINTTFLIVYNIEKAYIRWNISSPNKELFSLLFFSIPILLVIYFLTDSRLNGLVLESPFNNMIDGINQSPLAAVSHTLC